MLKRIVTIQDVSCFGKCSSTVALPLISAMGVETAVIPTAVLSTHTGGFTGYTFRDLTADIPQIAAHWKTLQLHFDGIYTGYLGSREQVQIMADFFDAFRSEDTVIVVDPVMGDAGSMYAGFTPDFAVEMRKLCGKADVIAPNMTEVSLLLGIPYAEQCPLETVKTYLKQLTEIGCPIAVITGIRNGDQHGAIAYDSTTGSYYAAYREHVPEPMHGTGDIFASYCAPIKTWNYAAGHRSNRLFPLRSTLQPTPFRQPYRICGHFPAKKHRGMVWNLKLASEIL